MKKLNYLTIVILLFSMACDKVSNPIPPNAGNSIFFEGKEFIFDPSITITDTIALKNYINNNTWDTVSGGDNSNQRFITLEEFTGHTCRQCPGGTREITRLKGVFGKQLIPVGIHSGNFAEPKPPPSDKYTSDYRVEGGHGEIYQSRFNLSGYPSGIVSRLGGTVSSVSQWEADINSIKDDTPAAILKMTNFYSSSLNVIRTDLEVEWKQSLAGQYNIQLYVVEDSIVDWQLDLNTDVENYAHRHVLRKVVNDTFGKGLQAASNGDKESIQYIIPINSSWKAQHIDVVAFIYNAEDNSDEVIQANSGHIQ